MVNRRECERRVSDCVGALLREQPFFGSLALRLPIRPDAGRCTLGSDGIELRYSPAWVAETGADQIKTAIARVCMACSLKHNTRRGERDPKRWQMASQMVTHALLEDAGFTLPEGARSLPDTSVEEAYEQLEGDGDTSDPDSPPSPAPEGAGGGDQGEGESGGEDGDGEQDTAGDDQPDDDGDQGEDEGSGEQPSIDPSGTGEVMDAPGAGDTSMEAQADIADLEQAWDETMHQALNLAKAEGNAPGVLADLIKNAHQSTLDWRSLLRRFMLNNSRSDYSWSVPNRRLIDSGLYLPSIYSEGLGRIAIIFDVSGSIWSVPEALEAFWSQLQNIATELKPEQIAVLQVDTAVQAAELYGAYSLPDALDIQGGGGTDFRPGFEWFEQEGFAPECCLYFTDMACSRYPDAEPPFPVLWCDYTQGKGYFASDPPWGEHIHIR